KPTPIRDKVGRPVTRTTPRELFMSVTPAYCPVCDASIEPNPAGEQATTCRACETRLIPAQGARFWPRGAAFMVDAAILLATAGALNVMLLWLVEYPGPWTSARGIDLLLRLLELSVVDLMLPLSPFLGMTA